MRPWKQRTEVFYKNSVLTSFAKLKEKIPFPGKVTGVVFL